LLKLQLRCGYFIVSHSQQVILQQANFGLLLLE